MHRTEGANHNGYRFQDGPPGTKIEENWLNAIQEEIAYVIETGGAALETAATETSTQLHAAILAVTGTTHRGALVYLGAAGQTINDSVTTNISWTNEAYDTSDISDISVAGPNPTRLTVPTGVTKIKLTAQIQFATDAVGIREVAIQKNALSGYVGRPYVRHDASIAGSTRINLVSATIQVIAGDFFNCAVRQESGGGLDVLGDVLGDESWFAMEIVQ
jgi:hypothetical protein